MPFESTGMNLEIVILSEVRQGEKETYHMILLICGIWKNWYKWTYLQNRNRVTDVENKIMIIGGRGSIWAGEDKLGG